MPVELLIDVNGGGYLVSFLIVFSCTHVEYPTLGREFSASNLNNVTSFSPMSLPLSLPKLSVHISKLFLLSFVDECFTKGWTYTLSS